MSEEIHASCLQNTYCSAVAQAVGRNYSQAQVYQGWDLIPPAHGNVWEPMDLYSRYVSSCRLDEPPAQGDCLPGRSWLGTSLIEVDSEDSLKINSHLVLLPFE